MTTLFTNYIYSYRYIYIYIYIFVCVCVCGACACVMCVCVYVCVGCSALDVANFGILLLEWFWLKNAISTHYQPHTLMWLLARNNDFQGIFVAVSVGLASLDRLSMTIYDCGLLSEILIQLTATLLQDIALQTRLRMYCQHDISHFISSNKKYLNRL